MGASATARRAAAAQRAPARKPAPRRATTSPAKRRRAQHTPASFVPVAVGRTAGAVGGLADSGLVIGLTRSRLWIGLLGGLLVGIVALNVMALSFSASSSNAASQTDTLKRQNSALRAQIATSLSNEEIQSAAAQLGLVFPQPGSVRYLRPDPDDAAEAAKRLRAGELGASSSAVAPPIEPYPEIVAVEPDPAIDAAATTAPAPVAEPAPPEPTAPAPVTEPTTETETVAPSGGGGVVSP